MREDKRAERFGAVLSLLYEFNHPMAEAQIMERSMKFSKIEDLRLLLSDLKRSDLITDLVDGKWRLTKKGKALLGQSP